MKSNDMGDTASMPDPFADPMDLDIPFDIDPEKPSTKQENDEENLPTGSIPTISLSNEEEPSSIQIQPSSSSNDENKSNPSIPTSTSTEKMSGELPKADALTSHIQGWKTYPTRPTVTLLNADGEQTLCMKCPAAMWMITTWSGKKVLICRCTQLGGEMVYNSNRSQLGDKLMACDGFLAATEPLTK